MRDHNGIKSIPFWFVWYPSNRGVSEIGSQYRWHCHPSCCCSVQVLPFHNILRRDCAGSNQRDFVTCTGGLCRESNYYCTAIILTLHIFADLEGLTVVDIRLGSSELEKEKLSIVEKAAPHLIVLAIRTGTQMAVSARDAGAIGDASSADPKPPGGSSEGSAGGNSNAAAVADSLDRVCREARRIAGTQLVFVRACVC